MTRFICAAASAFFICAMNGAAFFYHDFGDISIKSESTITVARGFQSHGYAAVRIEAVNRSPDKARRVEISFPREDTDSFWGPGRLKNVSKTIDAAPNSTAESYFYQPWILLDGKGDEAVVYIDGEKQEQTVYAFGLDSHGAGGSFRGSFGGGSWVNLREQPCVSFGAIGKSSLPVSSKVNPWTRHLFDSSWLAYSGYDGMILSLSEAETLSVEERAALLEYVKAGGSLAVMGEGKLPDDWSQLDSRLTNRELISDAVEQYEIGFGLLFLSGPPYYPTSSRPAAHTPIYDSWLETQNPWLRMYTASGANTAFPIVDPIDQQASYQRMFFLMLLLAAVIGPLNIAALKRKKQMMRLYWTVPAISLAACLLIFLYAVLVEGTGKQMRVASLTFLDQSARSASTLGWLAFYSPGAHHGGLLFDEETELTLQMEGLPRFGPMGMPAAAASVQGSSGSVDWTDRQRWTGWLRPRIPLHFKLRKNEDRPERIDLKRDGGDIKIVNRLGARVKSFWYADHGGKVYQASDVPNGAEAVLTETKGVKIGLKKLRDVYASQDWVAEIEAVKASPAAYLQPGRYFAELEENVFVEKALKGAKMKPSTCLVLGILE